MGGGQRPKRDDGQYGSVAGVPRPLRWIGSGDGGFEDCKRLLSCLPNRRSIPQQYPNRYVPLNETRYCSLLLTMSFGLRAVRTRRVALLQTSATWFLPLLHGRRGPPSQARSALYGVRRPVCPFGARPREREHRRVTSPRRGVSSLCSPSLAFLRNMGGRKNGQPAAGDGASRETEERRISATKEHSPGASYFGHKLPIC